MTLARAQALQEEQAELAGENRDLRKELDAYPEFFDEVEQLKFAYQQATRINAHYERQLELLSKQYGVAFSPLKATSVSLTDL